MVYDKQDRLVATQDANMRKAQPNKWLFTKYDKFGRVVYTGMTEDNRSRGNFQTYVNGFGKNNETAGNFTKNGLPIEYANSAFPTNIAEVFTVNYYDKYQNNYTPPNQILGQTTRTNLKGMPTETYIRILGQDTWESNKTVFDMLSKPIYSEKNNHLGGYTKAETKLDFRGKPETIQTKHKRDSNGIEITVKETFTYDHAERLTQHTHKVNDEATQVLTRNVYNEIGQLINKEVCGEGQNDRWQDVEYKYNIRGWLTDINNIDHSIDGVRVIPPAANEDLFAF